MAKALEVERILAAQIADPATGWSLGTFGAIAEFVREPDEPVATGPPGLIAVTARGGIRIRVRDDLRLVASAPMGRPRRFPTDGCRVLISIRRIL